MKQHTNRYYIFKRTCNRRLSKLQNITTSYVPTSDLFTKRWPNQKNSYWMNACRQNAVSNGSTSRNACKQIMCWGTEEELVCVPRQQSWAQNASIEEQTHDGCPSRTYRHASGHEPIEMWNSTKRLLATYTQRHTRFSSRLHKMPTKQEKPSSTARTLQSLAAPRRPGTEYALDFVTHLPFSSREEYGALLEIVDRFSKRVWLIPTRGTTTTEVTAMLFLKHIIYKNGRALEIVSDRDSKFNTKFWTAFHAWLGTALKLSSARHQAMNWTT